MSLPNSFISPLHLALQYIYWLSKSLYFEKQPIHLDIYKLFIYFRIEKKYPLKTKS